MEPSTLVTVGAIREELVVLLGEARVGADDQVGLERRDLLELDPVGRATTRVPRPRADPRPTARPRRAARRTTPSCDRRHPELQQDVLLGEARR